MFVFSWRCIRNSLLVTSKNTLTTRTVEMLWSLQLSKKKNRHLCTDRAFTKRVRAFKIELEFESVGFKKRVKPKYPEKNRFELSNRFNTLQLNKTVFNLVHSSVLLQFIDLCILLGCDYCDSIKGTKRFLCNSCILLGIIRPRTC